MTSRHPLPIFVALALDAEGYYHYRLERSEVRGRTVTLRAVEGDRIRPVVEYRVGS